MSNSKCQCCKQPAVQSLGLFARLPVPSGSNIPILSHHVELKEWLATLLPQNLWLLFVQQDLEVDFFTVLSTFLKSFLRFPDMTMNIRGTCFRQLSVTIIVTIFSQHFFGDFSSRCEDLSKCQIVYLFSHLNTVGNSRLTWMKVGSWSWCKDIPHLLNCGMAVQLLVADRTSPQSAFTTSVFYTIGETKTVSLSL